MNKYELMILVKAQSPQEERETIYKQAADAVVKSGGKVINSQMWLEKNKLAFSIKKCWEATYYLIKFEAAGNAIEKIRQTARLNEGILRFLITKMG